MKTIKRSELDTLKARAESARNWHELWCEAVSGWGRLIKSWRIQEYKIEKLKSTLWAAEQEIHDLKYEMEKQRENALTLNRALAQENIELFVQNQTLKIAPVIYKWGWAFTSDSEPEPEPEQLIPPPCLKPNDAMTWSNRVVESKWETVDGTV